MSDSKPLIYAVEDDEGVQEVYQGAFEDDYELSLFTEGKSFLTAFSRRRPDLVILDLMLPDRDGYSILTEIRSKDRRVPVIIVSARDDEPSSLKGFDSGADDYISKPFSILDLCARVKAALRRANLYVSVVEEFRIDTNTYQISFEDHDLDLTMMEYRLLKYLISNAGVTLTRDDLFREVWGTDFIGETRTLDIHIATLRDKIKKYTDKQYIVTVRGIGYRFEK